MKHVWRITSNAKRQLRFLRHGDELSSMHPRYGYQQGTIFLRSIWGQQVRSNACNS